MSENATAVSTGLRAVFVGGPFLHLVDPKTGRMSDQDQARFERLIGHFEQLGAKVYNAHRREAWGEEFLTAPEVTRLDFTEIARLLELSKGRISQIHRQALQLVREAYASVGRLDSSV